MINQPSNYLVNRLSLGALWSTPITSDLTSKFSFNYYFIQKFFLILVKSGILYSHHIFYHKFFIKSVELISLPAYITELRYSRFYRNYLIKLQYDKRFKTSFTTRSILNLINLSTVWVYNLNGYFIWNYYIYKPFLNKNSDFFKIKKNYKINVLNKNFYSRFQILFRNYTNANIL